MPIFEYVCKECHNGFETLVRASTTVACPACNSTSVEKQLSVFAAGVKGQSPAMSDMPVSACGACGDPRGPGACSMD
jgi:putative FmdB family regulatory protein